MKSSQPLDDLLLCSSIFIQIVDQCKEINSSVENTHSGCDACPCLIVRNDRNVDVHTHEDCHPGRNLKEGGTNQRQEKISKLCVLNWVMSPG
jgi:hypothetical protein